jgi:thioredoxin reductase (NADPH)
VPGRGPDEGAAAHDWGKMVSAVQDHISSLNFGYRVALREKGVEYRNALGAFTGPHALALTDKKGKVTSVTARRFIVAVGGRPRPLDCPGGELAISSDDLFSRAAPPGKTLVVGASYVALECAGFVAGLGYDTTVMARSIFLRGFDQQVAEKIAAHMGDHGVRFVRPATPTSIVKGADGRLTVTWANSETGEAGSDVFDTVFTAVGRVADTAKLGLAAAGVATDKDGKIPAPGEQSSAPHVYAIGDVVSGRPELTPVAIAAGKLLARRLYGGSTEGMDYERVPTTVFTPLEYGCVGLSEEAAVAAHGADALSVYHSSFTPLEWTISPARGANVCYAKLVVRKSDDRVVGFHVLGPNAGEITQGWAAAVRLGATYAAFTATVGIHPTVAEEFTGLTVTKASGESADKTGC